MHEERLNALAYAKRHLLGLEYGPFVYAIMGVPKMNCATLVWLAYVESGMAYLDRPIQSYAVYTPAHLVNARQTKEVFRYNW